MDALTNAVDKPNSELLEVPVIRRPKIKSKDLKKMVNITKHKLYKKGVMSFGFKL
jgi:hypothetical protein